MLAALLAVAEEAAEKVAEKLPELEVIPDPDELLWGSLFFFLLVIVLVKMVGPKVKASLAARTAGIKGQLEEAERVKRDADQLAEQYRGQLAEARAEAQKIIEEGRRTADSLKADIIAKAETEAQEIIARAQAGVAGERDRAVQELRGSLSDLSINIASRVLQKALTSTEDHRALVDNAIAELAGSTAGGGQTS